MIVVNGSQSICKKDKTPETHQLSAGEGKDAPKDKLFIAYRTALALQECKAILFAKNTKYSLVPSIAESEHTIWLSRLSTFELRYAQGKIVLHIEHPCTLALFGSSTSSNSHESCCLWKERVS